MTLLRAIGIACLFAAPVYGQASYSPQVSQGDLTMATQQVQAASTVTGGDGSWSVTWPQGFATVPTIATADVYAGTPPYICSVVTKTATTASGKCYQVSASTLPTTIAAVLGLVVSPIANPGAGLTVMVVGRQ